MKKHLHATLATAALLAATACAPDAPEPTAPDVGELVASASAWTPTDLTRDLPVDDATRRSIETRLGELHEAALALEGREPTEEEVRALHERHTALWESLDPDARAALAGRLHDRMRAHHAEAGDGDEDMATMHERMQRLHGGGHGPDGAGH